MLVIDAREIECKLRAAPLSERACASSLSDEPPACVTSYAVQKLLKPEPPFEGSCVSLNSEQLRMWSVPLLRTNVLFYSSVSPLRRRPFEFPDAPSDRGTLQDAAATNTT